MSGSQLHTHMRRILERLVTDGCTIRCLALYPKPLIAIETREENITDALDSAAMLGHIFARSIINFSQRVKERPTRQPLLYRCVGVERLSTILTTACDVEPTDAVLHAASSWGKAQEYGGKIKILMVFDGWSLEPCSCLVPNDTAPSELAEKKKLYPYQGNTDGQSIELRRLPATHYLHPFYSMWIPGDPWNALLAIFVVGQKQASVISAAQDCIHRCSIRWTIDGNNKEADTGIGLLQTALRETVPGSFG